MRHIHYLIIGIALIMMFGASGCGSRPTTLSEDFGMSYTAAKQGQILDPDAELNLEPVEGMDGVTSQEVIKRYHKMYEKPPFAITDPTGLNTTGAN